jgi:hypothetical protein
MLRIAKHRTFANRHDAAAVVARGNDATTETHAGVTLIGTGSVTPRQPRAWDGGATVTRCSSPPEGATASSWLVSREDIRADRLVLTAGCLCIGVLVPVCNETAVGA